MRCIATSVTSWPCATRWPSMRPTACVSSTSARTIVPPCGGPTRPYGRPPADSSGCAPLWQTWKRRLRAPAPFPGLHVVRAEAHREAADSFPDPLAAQDPEYLIRALLEGRQRARDRRAYAVADRVRTRLGDLGILVEDMPAGPRWRVAS